jgi:AcrR family transcriptional regulator
MQNGGEIMAKVKTTKLDIIRCASEMFFQQGYSATSPKQICERLDISTGNLTYYFPTKEHLLAVFTEMLCDYQQKMMEIEAEEGVSSVLSVCLELITMAAVCEDSEIAKEFYLASYTSPICLEIIRRNDTQRNKRVFAQYCPNWTDEQFVEAELIVSGIEYATLMTAGDPVSLEARIAGALNNILTIYNIPEELRKIKIEKVLKIDYQRIGQRVLRDFKTYIARENEAALEELINAKSKR